MLWVGFIQGSVSSEWLCHFLGWNSIVHWIRTILNLKQFCSTESSWTQIYIHLWYAWYRTNGLASKYIHSFNKKKQQKKWVMVSLHICLKKPFLKSDSTGWKDLDSPGTKKRHEHFKYNPFSGMRCASMQQWSLALFCVQWLLGSWVPPVPSAVHIKNCGMLWEILVQFDNPLLRLTLTADLEDLWQ